MRGRHARLLLRRLALPAAANTDRGTDRGTPVAWWRLALLRHPALHRWWLERRLHGARAHRRKLDAETRAVVVACARRAQRDLVAVAHHLFAADALTVDLGAVQAAEIAEHEPAVALLEDAVLLRDDLVEQLDRVVRVTTEAVDRPKLDRLSAFCGCQDQPCHSCRL